MEDYSIWHRWRCCSACRSLGYSPLPIELPFPLARPTLALGGQLKATFALGRGRHAFLSHHLGDLDNLKSAQEYEAAMTHYQALYRITPERLVHDLHPDYVSTRHALASPLERRAVQHHHAHLASCLAENQLHGPAIGVSFDGTGYGCDGALWGGEFPLGDYRSVVRAAHLLEVAMPGGAQAIREPWRMAAACLHAAGLDANHRAGGAGRHGTGRQGLSVRVT